MPELPGPEGIRLAFTGDLLTHLPVVGAAQQYGRDGGARYDFGPMLAPMEPILESADVAICHLEVPLAADQDATLDALDGAKVAHLSYTYDFNGYKIPGDAPFAVNQIVVQPIEKVGDTYVVFGLGNQLANQPEGVSLVGRSG